MATLTSGDANSIVAYQLQHASGMPIRPAPVQRDWMSSSRDRFAFRCLPLVIANQAGWVIECPRSFSARWDGSANASGVRLWFGPRKADTRIMSHFGEGVVTFWLPYLFRTPPGINLWVKGPSNAIKDGACALEGIVETDWSVAPFTMNWKLTRPGQSVRFEAGEPICMLVPVPRGLAESLQPSLRAVESNGGLAAAHQEWSARRARFLNALGQNESDARARGWEKDYMNGRSPNGDSFSEHQTRLHIKPFAPE